MSDGKIDLNVAERVALDFMTHITDMLAWHSVAGSIRRQKPVVGDIELVVMPRDPHHFLARLDNLIDQGIASRKLYSDGRTRWGDRYRGITYRGCTIELFLCDHNNRGYIEWLRTGPGMANTYVMSRMSACRSHVRFAGGYAWLVSYDAKHANYDRNAGYAKLGKLIVPDESFLFYLLGMSPVPPRLRSEVVYRQHLENWVHVPSMEALEPLIIPEPTQRRLFD
ncbi:MAG: hypothetical protein ACFE0Q_20675 [Anaerolineae bacterium]